MGFDYSNKSNWYTICSLHKDTEVNRTWTKKMIAEKCRGKPSRPHRKWVHKMRRHFWGLMMRPVFWLPMEDISFFFKKFPCSLRTLGMPCKSQLHTVPPLIPSKKQLFSEAHVSSFFILPEPLSKKSGYQKQLEQNQASFVFHLPGFTCSQVLPPRFSEPNLLDCQICRLSLAPGSRISFNSKQGGFKLLQSSSVDSSSYPTAP